MSKTWSKPSVYTPGVVVNGEEWRDWSSRIIPGKSTPGMSLELQLSEAKPLEFEVQFNTPGNGKSDQKLRTHLALLGFGLETEVSSGENSGKKLKHEFVVLDWSEQTGSAGQKIQFKFKKPSQKYTRLAAVTWVENLKNPVPLQITGGYL